MIKVGFITIGTPNILTSPILNNSGTKAIRAIDLFSGRLQTINIAIVKPNIHPVPPVAKKAR